MTYADNFSLRAPSTVKMNDVANAVDGLISRMGGVTATGTANAQAVTLSPVPAAYSELTGTPVAFFPVATNTGAATLNVNSLGTKTVQYKGKALVGGELVGGVLVVVVYDGTNFQVVNHGGGKASWTPTLGASGSMTYTGTTILASSYQRHGNFCKLWAAFSGTTGGTANKYLTFTLPVNAANLVNGAGVSIYEGGTTKLCGQLEQSSASTVIVSRYDGANWGLGASRAVYVSGFEYEV
jgi:hypothetical protein